jgi:hypothetical protein
LIRLGRLSVASDVPMDWLARCDEAVLRAIEQEVLHA